MRFKFLNLHIENFMSFEEADISFEETGYTIVSGKNENPDDQAYSNGSGKSSIWEALSWVLTGSTIRGCRNVCNMYIPDNGALVSLQFLVDGKHYQLIRSKDHVQYKTNLQIFIDGENRSGKGIRESEAILSQILPDLSPSLIGSVIILGQGLPARLSARTPAGRKELLEELTKSDFMIEDIKQRLTARKENLNKQINEKQTTLAGLRGKQESLRAELDRLQAYLQEMEKTCPNDWEEIERSLVRENDELRHRLLDLKTQIDDTNCALTDVTSKYEYVLDQKSRDETQISNSFASKMQEAQQQFADSTAELAAAERTFIKFKNQPTVCPTCGRPLPPSTEINPISESDLKSLQDRVAETRSVLQVVEQERQAALCELATSVEQILSGLRQDKQSQQQKFQNLATERDNLQQRISANDSNIGILKIKLESYYKEIEAADTRCDSIKEELAKMQEETLYHNNEINDLNNRLAIITRMTTSASRDFRGFLLENILQYLCGVMQFYCKCIFDHTHIALVSNNTSLDIMYCDKLYEALSGGERQKIDLITQLALRQMLCKLMDFDSNILVLDEIFDAMDAVSCRRVIDFISSELSGVESIYIITHHTDLQIPCDHEICVIKDRTNISRIL